MKKDWVLTQEGWSKLLNWLDKDTTRAATKYETIRSRLIKVSTCRGCVDAEELADETINRVVSRIDDIAAQWGENDPILYFYRVFHNVYLEYLRKCSRRADVPVEIAADSTAVAFRASSEDIESVYDCLEQCLDQLPQTNRKLVLEYHQNRGHAKIEDRKRLATDMGIAVNALRIRAHRIRRGLGDCVRACLENQPAH